MNKGRDRQLDAVGAVFLFEAEQNASG